MQVDHLRVRAGVAEAGCGGPVAVRGSVVHDPEHAPGRGVGLGGHDLVDEGGERLDPGGRLAAADDLRAVDVVGGQVGQGSAAGVLALGPHRPAWSRGSGSRTRERA